MPSEPVPPMQTQDLPSGLQPSNPDPMFDPALYTQAGLPHLIQLLVQEYQEFIARANQKREEEGKPLLDSAKTIEFARPLLNFFEAYLRRNRPATTFPIDMNYGIQLTNGKQFAVSPGVVEDFRGSMQNSGAVNVTHGRSQPGGKGSYDDGGVHL